MLASLGVVRASNRLVDRFGAARSVILSRTLVFHTAAAAPQHQENNLLTTLLSGFLSPYFEMTPSSEAALTAIEEMLTPGEQIGFDHIAFRTFGVEHLGISSLARWFTDLGYIERGELSFPAKRLRAMWYSPPQPELPRLFVSEIKVEELSPKTLRIIEACTSAGAAAIGKYGGPATGLLGVPPWQPPTLEDFKTVAAESEYASWVLVNGYMLNHTTVAVHRLPSLREGIIQLVAGLKEQGFNLNAEGGEVKRSPDGLLLQSSTVADNRLFTFAGGECEPVPSGYIEFAERLVLPEFSHLKVGEVEEQHRRDGFEVGNADRIFESTTLASKQDL